MFELSEIVRYLAPLQWFAAITFVPLVCWQYCARKSISCRWVSLLSGYAVQIGFFLLLDDAGFQANLLILISSIAAYFWITTTVALWPKPKLVPPSQKSEISEPIKSVSGQKTA